MSRVRRRRGLKRLCDPDFLATSQRPHVCVHCLPAKYLQCYCCTNIYGSCRCCSVFIYVGSPRICTLHTSLGCPRHTPVSAQAGPPSWSVCARWFVTSPQLAACKYVRAWVWQLLGVCNRNVMRSFTRRCIGRPVILRKLFNNTVIVRRRVVVVGVVEWIRCCLLTFSVVLYWFSIFFPIFTLLLLWAFR